MVSSLLWNQRSRGSISELELTPHSALQLATRMSRKNPCCNLCGYIFHHRLWCLLWHKCETDASGFDLRDSQDWTALASYKLLLPLKCMFVRLFQGNLRSWLMDTHCYDQYSVIYEGGDRTAIMNNAHNEPTVIEERAVSLQKDVKILIIGDNFLSFLSDLKKTLTTKKERQL